MRQGILFIDKKGIITTCNVASKKILGIGNKELTFQAFKEHFEDDIFEYSMKVALEEGVVPEVMFLKKAFPGSKKEKELKITTQKINKGPVAYQGLFILIKDVTEIRHLEQIASRNDRLHELGEMAASVAHEIRNPLGGIEGFAALLHRDLKDESDQKKMSGALSKRVISLIFPGLLYQLRTRLLMKF